MSGLVSRPDNVSIFTFGLQILFKEKFASNGAREGREDCCCEDGRTEAGEGDAAKLMAQFNVQHRDPVIHAWTS